MQVQVVDLIGEGFVSRHFTVLVPDAECAYREESGDAKSRRHSQKLESTGRDEDAIFFLRSSLRGNMKTESVESASRQIGPLSPRRACKRTSADLARPRLWSEFADRLISFGALGAGSCEVRQGHSQSVRCGEDRTDASLCRLERVF